MEVLILKGKKYVKASKAAKDLGYSSDYVGQLCRGGSVDAHLVGRTWYVNPDTLGAHRIEKKRNARVKAREHARKSIEEAKSLIVKDDAKTFRNIAIRYGEDSNDLIPEVRKVSIESHKERVEPEIELNDSPAYTIENENAKVLFKGTLKVVDAELEDEYTDTTILSARIVKQHPSKVRVEEEPEDAVVEVEKTDLLPQEAPRMTFEERILRKGKDEAVDEGGSIAPAISVLQEDRPAPRAASSSNLTFWLSGVAIVILGVLSIIPVSVTTYREGISTNTYAADTSAITEFINKNKVISDSLGFIK